MQDARLLKDLIEHMPVGVVVHGPQSEIISANQTAADILGLSIDQMLGKVAIDPAWRFEASDGSPMALADYPVNRVLASRASVRDLVIKVHRPVTRDVVWVVCNAFPSIGSDGAVLQVITCFTDVTALKVAEQALQASEERLNLVLKGSSDAPWDWDLVAGTMYYSPRWWQMIGREFNEVAPTPDLWISWLHPDDGKRVQGRMDELLTDPAITSFEEEFQLAKKSGGYLPVLCRGFILRNAAGIPIRLSGTNMDLTERKQTEARIHQLAYFDVLTGLPNRTMLIERLKTAMAMAQRTRQKGALLFIDLDNFKSLNDTLGHDVGDKLLKMVAGRLQQSVRKSDQVARLGGDEFVVVLENLGEDLQVAAIESETAGQKIVTALNESFYLSNQPFRTSPSIGITLFDEDSCGCDELLKQADVAMYQAKAAGRNTLRFFDPSMQAEVDQRVAMENDLRAALQNGELRLHCQPQVNHKGELIGGEALVRWDHPVRGMVTPDQFIPLSEATGLILPLGEWVLESACRTLVQWERNARLASIPLSVNISVHQVRDPDFVSRVMAILQRTGANPARLRLELTESLMADNVNDVITKMNALRAEGIRFSLDDFGTGYSSLSYLKRFPLAELKIDRTFTRDVMTDPNDVAIIEIIIALAKQLGLDVVAEGVETEAQFEFLLSRHCGVFQGYLFGRPVPIEQFGN